MARDNYSYQKYRRELAKKKKKEEKIQRKLDKKNRGSVEDAASAPTSVEDLSVNPDGIINGQNNKDQ